MRVASLAAMLAAFLTSSAFGADAFAGTWKEDVAKSHNNWSKEKPAGSRMRTYTARPEGGYDVKVNSFDDDGKPTSVTLVAGTNKEQAIKEPSGVTKRMGATHVVSKRVDDHTMVATYMKDGKSVGTSSSKVSADGSTLTMVLKGTAADGKPMSATSVYRK